MSKLLISHMRDRFTRTGKRGAIYDASSLSALFLNAGVSVYAATKSFNLAFSRVLHRENKGSGVDVFGAIIGSVKSNLNEGLFPYSTEA